jgi:hypothetical protein
MQSQCGCDDVRRRILHHRDGVLPDQRRHPGRELDRVGSTVSQRLSPQRFHDGKSNLYLYTASLYEHFFSMLTPPLAYEHLRIQTINGTQVVPSQGVAQPYAMIGSVIKNLSSTDRANGQLSQGFTLDKYGQTQITATLTDTADIRQKYYMYGPTAACATRQFSLTYRLADAGLRTRGGWLPPNCQIQIRARRSQPQMMRIGKGTEVTAAAPIFTITSATCMMARKVLSIESRARLESMWSAMPLRVPFEQTRTSVNWFGIGAQVRPLTLL